MTEFPDKERAPRQSPAEIDATENLAEAIRRRFAPLGGVNDLEIPPREPDREPPQWLQKAWDGTKARGLDALTPDDIDAEIAAHRREQRDGGT